jgi:hypothetical protein
LEDGKEIDDAEAEEQAKDVQGQEAIIPEEVLEAVNKAEADQYMKEHFFFADPDNPLDQGYTLAWRLGDLNSALRLIPDDISANANRLLQGLEDYRIQDTWEGNFNRMDTMRAMAYADWGKFGGLMRRLILSPAERGHMAYLNTLGVWEQRYQTLEEESGLASIKPNFLNLPAKNKFHNTTWKLMDAYKQEYTSKTNRVIAGIEEIADILQGYSREEQNILLNWARGLRLFWDEVLTVQNAFRVKYGQEAIPYHDSYVTWCYEPNVWARAMGFFYANSLRPDFLTDPTVTPDFIHPASSFVAHSYEREGGLKNYSKVKDVRRLFLDYADVAARDMFFTGIIKNTKAYVPFVEKTAPNFAHWLMNWVSESYAGQASFFSRAIRKTPFGIFVRPIVQLRRLVTRAVFPLNWSWNFFVQTSSLALTVQQQGAANMFRGAAKYIFDRKARKLVQENCYSYIIKQRRLGSVVYQDIGQNITYMENLRRSPLEKAEQLANFLTRAIEDNLTGISCAAGLVRGQQLGLTGRALIDYASEAGAKSQSMYNIQNVPGVLRAKEIGALFPFQTFAFEALNSISELSNIKFLRAGTYETVAANSVEGQGLIQNRMKHFAEFMAAIFVLNVIGEMAIDRKPWQPTSFIPMWSIIMGGIDPHNQWNYPLPYRYALEAQEGIKNWIEVGDTRRFRNWVIRYHTPAGVQSVRTIDAILALTSGEVREVPEERGMEGDVMFKVKPEEWFRAIFTGIYTTEGGKEYSRTHFEGLDSTTRAILEKFDEEEEQLGTSVDGQYYTLSDFSNFVMTQMESQNIPRWQIAEEGFGFSDLARFRVYCDVMWTEYYNLPNDQKLDYRRQNPYVDASLVFWERVQNPRTETAKEELGEIFKMFNVDDNPRWHMRGLPIIPEEFYLLPE